MTLSPPILSPPAVQRRLNLRDRSGFWVHLFKRCVDLGFGAAMIPIICLMAIVLWLINPLFNSGPVFFGQWRMGQGQVPFYLWKFRTLTQDQKITGLGAFLRKTHLDETPQCWNLLKGEMALVGPRPEQVGLYWTYVAQIKGFAVRQRVRPGLTGVSQVKLGYTDDAEGAAQKLRWDLVYIRGWSLRMELSVLWRTLCLMF